jgi:hypothetical protein
VKLTATLDGEAPANDRDARFVRARWETEDRRSGSIVFGVSGIAAAKINRTADPRLLNATAAAGARQLCGVAQVRPRREVPTMLEVPSMRIAETFEYTPEDIPPSR